MTRSWISLPAALLAVTAATAQTPDVGPYTVRLSADDCRRLIPHAPAPDVAYRPGVDVHGRDVAPADLGGGPVIALPEVYEFVIAVDLAQRFGIPSLAAGFVAEGAVGVVAFDGERLTFNGQPLTPEAEPYVAGLCAATVRD
ncbi:MAG: hypothetical protein ACTS3R_10035 [Inquilinaceae bacterium]